MPALRYALAGSALLTMTVCVAAPVQADVLYQETFDNGSGGRHSLDTYGWHFNYSASGTTGDSSSTANTAVYVGNAGFVYDSVQVPGGRILLWTDELPLGAIDISDVGTVTFELRNVQTDNENIRLAIKVDDEWYATQTSYNNTDQDVWELQTVDFSTVAWNNLSFVADTTLAEGSAASLPTSGTVNAIGFFDDARTNSRRFDTLTINAVPEPASLTLMGLGGLLVIRRRR